MAEQTHCDLRTCTPDEREQLIDRLAAERNALLDDLFRVILAAQAEEDHLADGALTMRDWIAYRCNVSTATAHQWLRAAKALEDLPRIRERFVEGAISWEQLRLALSFAKPAEDAHLAELLPSLSCHETEVMAKQRRRLRRDETDKARRQAHLRFRRDRSGLGSRVSGFLPNEDAAIVEAALDRRAEAAGPDPETGIWAPHEQRLAGALRDLAAEDLARAASGGSEPDVATVVVHAPATSPTDASNLMGVCWHHHHLLHEGGWDACGDADGEIVLTGPHGREVRSRAGPIAA